jgi:hypothetical protein
VDGSFNEAMRLISGSKEAQNDSLQRIAYNEICPNMGQRGMPPIMAMPDSDERANDLIESLIETPDGQVNAPATGLYVNGRRVLLAGPSATSALNVASIEAAVNQALGRDPSDGNAWHCKKK